MNKILTIVIGIVCIVLYNDIIGLSQHCNNIDEDFDQDGAWIYGLKHLKMYTKDLIEDDSTILPVIDYTEAENARLVSYNKETKETIFEIMNYVENHKMKISLYNQTDKNLSDYIGQNAMIAYDLTHHTLIRVLFNESNKKQDKSFSCTNENIIARVYDKVQKRYNASGNSILSDAQVEALRQKRYQQLAQMQLVNISSDGSSEMVKMVFCKGEITRPNSNQRTPIYFDLEQTEEGVPNILLYFQGDQQRRNAYRLFKQYKEECNNNNQQSCFKLADRYLYGRGVKQSYQKALQLYDKSCKSGIAHACTRIGFIYEISRDYFNAVKFYKEGCNKGDYTIGCNSLGVLYTKGLGTTQNIKKAKELFSLGCNAGNNQACQNYTILNSIK